MEIILSMIEILKKMQQIFNRDHKHVRLKLTQMDVD